MLNIKEKIVLVTGGSKGIGDKISLKFIENGAKVISLGREKSSSFDKRVIFYKCDISNYGNVKKTISEILNLFGKIDILVNNAGIKIDKMFYNMSEDDFSKVIDVNIKGTFNVTKEVINSMIKARSGNIINIASVVGIRGNIGQVNYGASKAAIIGMTKSLAKEYAKFGIRVNVVAPGFIDEGMTSGLNASDRDNILKRIPFGRFGKGEEIANSVVFLASDMSSYITGAVLVVDGGLTI